MTLSFATTLPTERYQDQAARWPAQGRHILAHHDAETIVVYQAYRPAIAEHALRHRAFGGEFSFSRMSWIKPNFLWMMFRSGWGTKPGQERVLGLRLRRGFFEALLGEAVASSFAGSGHALEEDWKAALAGSQVRLQWDPDHGPRGEPLARRAIQLGLRGDRLKAFGTHELLQVIDMTPMVAEQRAWLEAGEMARLDTSAEWVFVPGAPEIARQLGLTE